MTTPNPGQEPIKDDEHETEAEAEQNVLRTFEQDVYQREDTAEDYIDTPRTRAIREDVVEDGTFPPDMPVL